MKNFRKVRVCTLLPHVHPINRQKVSRVTKSEMSFEEHLNKALVPERCRECGAEVKIYQAGLCRECLLPRLDDCRKTIDIGR